MDCFENRNYVINKRLLYYTGMWPRQARPQKLFFRTIVIGLFVSLLIPKLLRLWMVKGSLSGWVECVPVLCVDFVAAVKYLTWTINHKQMEEVLFHIEEAWNGNVIDHETLTHYAERSRSFTVGYTLYMASANVCYLIMPQMPTILDIFVPQNVSRERVYLVQVEYFVNPEKYYFWILIHSYIVGPISMVILIAYDTTFAVQVQHACGLLSSVGEFFAVTLSIHLIQRSAVLFSYTAIQLITFYARVRLREIRGRDSTKMEKHEQFSEGRDEAYNDIVTCMKIHKQAIEFSTLIESSNSISFIFIIGVAIVALTLIGYATMANLDNPADSIRYGAFVLGEIMHIWYLSWQGQQLLDHSVNILHDAYNVDFVNISISAQRLLIPMMLRSSKPFVITAGKVYILSMESFSVALKTSMSYFTVLLSMQ